MMTKHTPGPWGAKTVHVRGMSWLATAHFETKEGEANVRLITAAPDMFDMLEAICAADWSKPTEADMMKIYEARATLREIKGEQ